MCDTCKSDPCSCPAPPTVIEEGMPGWAQEMAASLTANFTGALEGLRASLTPPAPQQPPTPEPAPVSPPAATTPQSAAPTPEAPGDPAPAVPVAASPSQKPKAKRGVLTVRLFG